MKTKRHAQFDLVSSKVRFLEKIKQFLGRGSKMDFNKMCKYKS